MKDFIVQRTFRIRVKALSAKDAVQLIDSEAYNYSENVLSETIRCGKQIIRREADK